MLVVTSDKICGVTWNDWSQAPLISQKRDAKGRFSSENPKRILMRVTKQEKQIIERFRQIKPHQINNYFLNEIQALIRRRVQNLEL